MWLDGFQWEKAHVRLSEWRVREAVAATNVVRGEDFVSAILSERERERKQRRQAREQEPEPREVQILAVACPYEAPRFEDAAKTVEGGERLLVRDIAELLVAAMGDEEEAE
jgi:hypothetical protein